MLTQFGHVVNAQIANLAITNAKIAAAALVPEKRRGYQARGRATLVAGTVTVVPGPAVVITDVIELVEGDGAAGVENPRYVDAVAPGAAGVGSFDITSGNVGDIAAICWVQYDNTYIG